MNAAIVSPHLPTIREDVNERIESESESEYEPAIPIKSVKKQKKQTKNNAQHQPQTAQHQPQTPPQHQPQAPQAMSACDKLTMETMMNMDTYSKCMKNRTQASTKTTPQQMQADSTERRFYRRRIIDITKEMCRSSENRDAGNADTAVLNTFNAYIRACIMHFKFIDLADTLQDEYAGLETSDGVGVGVGVVDSGTNDLSDLSKFDKLCFNPAANGAHPAQSKIVQISAPSSNSLERLFMAKAEPKESKDKNGNSESFLSTLPKIKDVNLMDEQFKMKGITSGGKKNKCKTTNNNEI